MQRKKAAAQRDAYKLTLKTLESLEGASPDEVAACAGAAAAAAADFIRSPETFQFDMLESPAVQQLQSDATHGPVFTLLSLLLAGDVQVRRCNRLNLPCLVFAIMLEFPAVQQLRSDAQHSPVCTLLLLLLAGDMQI